MAPLEVAGTRTSMGERVEVTRGCGGPGESGEGEGALAVSGRPFRVSGEAGGRRLLAAGPNLRLRVRVWPGFSACSALAILGTGRVKTGPPSGLAVSGRPFRVRNGRRWRGHRDGAGPHAREDVCPARAWRDRLGRARLQRRPHFHQARFRACGPQPFRVVDSTGFNVNPPPAPPHATRG